MMMTCIIYVSLRSFTVPKPYSTMMTCFNVYIIISLDQLSWLSLVYWVCVGLACYEMMCIHYPICFTCYITNIIANDNLQPSAHTVRSISHFIHSLTIPLTHSLTHSRTHAYHSLMITYHSLTHLYNRLTRPFKPLTHSLSFLCSSSAIGRPLMEKRHWSTT